MLPLERLVLHLQSNSQKLRLSNRSQLNYALYAYDMHSQLNAHSHFRMIPNSRVCREQLLDLGCSFHAEEFRRADCSHKCDDRNNLAHRKNRVLFRQWLISNRNYQLDKPPLQ